MNESELESAFKIFQLQGFESPMEMFVLGYIMAHGGEQVQLRIAEKNVALLEGSNEPKFWIPHIKDDNRIWRKVNEEDVVLAHRFLIALLQGRKARIPEWLEKIVLSEAGKDSSILPKRRNDE